MADTSEQVFEIVWKILKFYLSLSAVFFPLLLFKVDIAISLYSYTAILLFIMRATNREISAVIEAVSMSVKAVN